MQAHQAASLLDAGTSGEGQEADGKKEKRARRKKDPAAPKKALTGYLVYINSKREQVIKEHPEADLKDQVATPHPSAAYSAKYFNILLLNLPSAVHPSVICLLIASV